MTNCFNCSALTLYDNSNPCKWSNNICTNTYKTDDPFLGFRDCGDPKNTCLSNLEGINTQIS